MAGPRIEGQWPIRLLLVLVSLALHLALLAWLLSARLSAPQLEPTQPIAVQMIELPVPVPEPEPEPVPEPEPEPVPEPEPEPAPKPPPPPAAKPRAAPAPAAPRAPVKRAGPPVHSFGANTEWAAPAAPTPPPAARGRLAPSGYADTVKNRVIAHLKRPDGAVYKAPSDYDGDPAAFNRKCFIAYRIIVDGRGKMLSYQLDRCGDALLDAAAEQAILKAGPFPAPPNQGAASYTVHGTAIFIK